MASAAGDGSGEAFVAPKSEDERTAGACEEPGLQERVDVKEQVCKAATDLLTRIISLGETGCKIDETWVQRAEMVLKEYASFSYEVGVAGDTGMGKTSLMNALLGYSVAPESQLGACTAAPCRFKYNKTQEAGKFQATVIFKSKHTVDEELKKFFSLLSLVSAAADDDIGDPSASCTREEQESCDQYLEIVSAWSGIETTILRSYGLNDRCHEITSKSAVTKFFNLKHTTERMSFKLNAKTEKHFVQQIRPYVSGIKADAKYWPLVECVDVYVPSEFLSSGITLVDLPGELDATESRSEVARKYYNKLDRLMVVTPCDRAADNKTAIDLLRDDQILELDAAGQIDNGMCVVSTKIDQLDWEGFAESAMPADQIAPNFQALLDEYETTKEKLEENGDDDELQSRLDELEKKCFSFCIDARNREIRKSLQKYFDKIRNAHRKKPERVQTQLAVFPVSSRAESRLRKGKPERCFGDSKATGFEDLKSWARSSLLEERERFIDKLLHDCVALFAAGEGWLESEFGLLDATPQALTSSLKEVKFLLGCKKKDLRDASREFVYMMGIQANNTPQNLSKVTTNFRSFLDRELKRVSFSREHLISRLKDHFVERIRYLDRETELKTMHPATFDACVRRCGALYRTSRRPRKTYDWQGKLKMHYWSVFLSDWTQSFQRWFPRYLRRMLQGSSSYLSNHNYHIMQKGDMPQEYVHLFQRYSYKVENIGYEARGKVESLMSQYVRTLRTIAAGSRELLSRKMHDLYVEASQQKGKGKYARQKAAMEKAAKVLKESLFHEVGDKLDEQLKTAQKTFSDGVKETNDEIQKKLFSLEDMIALKIYAPPPKESSKKMAEAENVLREQLGQVLDEWKEQWEVLREKIPDLQMQFVNDEEIEKIKEAEERRGALDDDTDMVTTQKPSKRSKQSCGSGRKKRKAKETTSTKGSGAAVEQDEAAATFTVELTTC